MRKFGDNCKDGKISYPTRIYFKSKQHPEFKEIYSAILIAAWYT
jgi:hypothetical protein